MADRRGHRPTAGRSPSCRYPAPGGLASSDRRRLGGFVGGFDRLVNCSRRARRLACLDLLDGQFELADLARQPLRRPAELLPAQLVELHLQLLELERLELQRFEGEMTLGKERAHQLPQAVN